MMCRSAGNPLLGEIWFEGFTVTNRRMIQRTPVDGSIWRDIILFGGKTLGNDYSLQCNLGKCYFPMFFRIFRLPKNSQKEKCFLLTCLQKPFFVKFTHLHLLVQ